MPELELKIGSWVRIRPEGNIRTVFNPTHELANIRKRQIYGIIQYGTTILNDEFFSRHPELKTHSSYQKESWGVSIGFCDDKNKLFYTIRQADLEVIPEEEYDKYKKIVEEYVAEKYALQMTWKELFKNPSKGTYSDIDCARNIFLELANKSKIHMQTQYVYANRVKIDFRSGKVSDLNMLGFAEDCCDYVKTDKDLDLYLPLYYLNYYGYSVYDVHKWLQFIENCNIGFKYILEGEVGLPEEYKNKNLPKCATKINEDLDEEFIFAPQTPAAYPNLNTKFLQIKIKNPGANFHIHMHLMLVRYLHHMNNWFIPAQAMQIKDALGEKISNWQALLMAHFHPSYTNVDRGLLNGFQNIFCDAQKVVDNIRKNAVIQTSFEYIPSRNVDRKKCQDMIVKKEYEQLLEFLKPKV